MLFEPLVSFDAIEMHEANAALVAWGHRMGPFNRPNYGNRVRAHGLRHLGELVGLTVTDRAISEEVAGLPRDELIELARVCAARRDLNRVVVRLWREFVFPAIARDWGASWAISYQHATMHNGDLYRFDGWKPIGQSRSGTDQRSGRKGYSKVIWGWHLPQAEKGACAGSHEPKPGAEPLAQRAKRRTMSEHTEDGAGLKPGALLSHGSGAVSCIRDLASPYRFT